MEGTKTDPKQENHESKDILIIGQIQRLSPQWGNWVLRGGWEGEGGGRRQVEEMAQTMYAHMNKWILKNSG
jgi:hypothetical protein